MKEFIFPMRIYIDDTDCYGIVYHANYLKFFERARSEWSEQLDYGLLKQQEQNVFFTICSAKLDYLKPARAHQLVEVVTRIKELRHASLIYDQCLREATTTDTILCRAEIKVACVDKNLRPRKLPKDLIQLLGE
jgi:acyl-CoA thioester hydrolase